MHKIRQKILLITLIPSMIMLGVLSIYLLHTRSHDLREQFHQRGNAVARQLAAAALNGVLKNRHDILELLAQEVLNSDAEVQKIRFTNPHGLILAEKGQEEPAPPMEGLETHFTSSITPAYDLKGIYHYLLDQPVPPGRDGKLHLGEVSVWLDPRPLAKKQQEIVVNTVMLALTGLLAIALLSVFLSQRIAHPLEELTQAARKLRGGQLDARVPLDESGEVGELQKAFNEMAQEISVASETLHAQVEQATRELQESMEILEIKNVELDLARKKALEANRVKSEFLASMSHEIRTPMNGILGFTNLLRRTSLNKVQLEYLRTIEISAGNLLAIINDILDLSRLEAGKLNLEHAPFSIRQCIDETVSLLAPMAHQKQLELVSFVYDDVPDNLLGDRTRIAQIVTNLLNNAIKFTHEGEVVLRLSLEEERDESVEVLLTVTDTGIGIPREEQEHIFDTFVQGQANQGHATGGTGLGLSICRRLAESMHGSISVSSEPGEGSTFACHLRLARNLQSLPRENGENPLSGKRICLLESHPASRQAVAGLLTSLGAVVKFPEGPADPFSLESYPEVACDAFILCLGARQLEDPALQQQVGSKLKKPGPPMVLLLGTSTQELMDSFMEQGAALCMGKPVRRSALLHGLTELFSSGARPSARSLPAPPAPPEQEAPRKRGTWLAGKRILIADDSRINRQLVEILLEDLGATVFSAADGREALEIAVEETLDLALLDIHMPRMNGIETALAIRKLPGLERLPVVAMTADVMGRNRQQITRSGFHAYLLKPIEEQELWLVLQDTLFGRKPAPPPREPEKPAPVQHPLPEQESLAARDLAQALRITGGSRRIADNLFSQFLETLPDEMAGIEKLLHAEQWQELWQAVHHLQGSVAVCGIPAFAATLKRLQSCVTEEDREGAAQAYRQMLLEQERLQQIRPRADAPLRHHA